MGVCVLGDRAFDQGLALTGREGDRTWETITFDSGVGAITILTIPKCDRPRVR